MSAPGSSFSPLRVAKRKFKAYTSIATEPDDYYDDEKALDESDYLESPTSTSAYSSRATSSSYQGMLRHVSGSSARKAKAYSYRPPRRYARYFTLVLLSIVIIFILTLVRQSWASAKSVYKGFGRPAGPHAWEAFPFLTRYHGGIRTLVPRSENRPEYPGNHTVVILEKPVGQKRDEKEERGDTALPKAQKFSPFPNYSSQAYKDEYTEVAECFLDSANTIRIPQLLAYPGVPKGMPENVMGSYSMLGLRDDICFERFGRLGPYGLGYPRHAGGSGSALGGDRDGADDVWAEEPEVDFRKVNWADAQRRCSEANRHRFNGTIPSQNNVDQMLVAHPPNAEGLGVHNEKRETQRESSESDAGFDADSSEHGLAFPPTSIPAESQASTSTTAVNKRLPRTALLLRTWHNYEYDDEDLLFLRALVAELSLLSGGEYEVHFLIHVKDDDKQIWADEETYQSVLDSALPPEFRGMGTLWSERQMSLIYGGLEESMYRGLPVYGAYRSSFMPVQYFSHRHPEYDYIWHWEMDVRYTGHFYHLFDKVSQWAAQQPRKGLWERNSRFYVPSEHGSWEDFKHLVRVQTEHGTSTKSNIWTELAAKNPNLPAYAQPQQQAEKPIWGADPPLDDVLETQNDPFPPQSIKDDKHEWGVGEEADLIVFNPLFDPAGTNWILADDVTGYNKTHGLPPRRTAINTSSRMSRRLLETMHRETALKRHTMFSEMWPGTCALHHGFKAVYAPHPVFVDRQWPTDYLAAIFNGGRNGASGGARPSVFSDERQHNFLGTTWYYHAGFAPNLWKRWLGYKVDNDGGEEWEVLNEGRMCLPAMLLHPVKQVDLVVEGQEKENEDDYA
ncbi:hypothetical protein P152DRAFT_456826 [Eremomyces bilateralis CBS 781.70]|uniref:Uncharacterized protein n=1 Tax=Eremomyces bilateralis CBS 781.70 TaxID=1392243 RepID=A0A6G1G902_9PEZI|nr:uncharacterized protein P152DRAFT_456826 [Eremomyces bilateralis CBS 781.70]KAF1814558.1 hypothetical protein P152DRAFT_456826 [Eremomyces bilateralis CBS 781.70]